MPRKFSLLGLLRDRGRRPAAADSRSDLPMKIPVHLGIIMDGNGRWAEKRSLPRRAGHRAGADTLHDITEACGRLGVRYMTVYAFSTENWRRPNEEIHALMRLFTEYFNKYDESLERNNVRVRFMGEKEMLPEDVRNTWDEAVEKSSQRTGMQMIVAFNYGGRQELVQAVQGLAADAAAGRLDPSSIDESVIESRLYLPDVPAADLIIRSSGEMRLSNFLLWQSAYAEFWVSNILWPDFTPADLEQAFRDFGRRGRRFGGLDDAGSGLPDSDTDAGSFTPHHREDI